jgi:hypothetical protein
MNKEITITNNNIEKGKDRLDVFKEHLLGNRNLTSNRDVVYFEKLAKAWGWACKMYSPQQIVKMLNIEYGHEKTFAYQVLNDAFRLYGDAYDINREGVLKTLIEAAHLALSISIRDKESEGILKSIDRLYKMYGFDKGEVNNLPPASLRMPGGTRVYTSGPVQINNIEQNGSTGTEGQ